MKSKWMTGGFCALILSAAAAPVLATPADRTIGYTIYNDPEQPSLGIRYQFEIEVSYVTTSGNQCGWEVESVTVARMNTNGTLDKEWIDVLPDVATTDGLWWTTHNNVENPLTKEFTIPPLVTGFASTSGSSDMEYALAGTTCSGNCKTDQLEVPAILSLTLQEIGDEDPELDDAEGEADTDDL